MTVRELYNWCKAYKYKDAEVYVVIDWEEVSDEDAYLTDLHRVNDVVVQTKYIDLGLEFKEERDVLICFDAEKAKPEIHLP